MTLKDILSHPDKSKFEVLLGEENERGYLSRNKEPLGTGYTRGFEIPVQNSDFKGFGLLSKPEVESTLDLIFPRDKDNTSKCPNEYNNNNGDVSTQTQRSYNWPPEYLVKSFRFGKTQTNSLIHGTKECLIMEGPHVPSKIVNSKVDDFKDRNHYIIEKDLVFGSKTFTGDISVSDSMEMSQYPEATNILENSKKRLNTSKIDHMIHTGVSFGCPSGKSSENTTPPDAVSIDDVVTARYESMVLDEEELKVAIQKTGLLRKILDVRQNSAMVESKESMTDVDLFSVVREKLMVENGRDRVTLKEFVDYLKIYFCDVLLK